MANRKNTVLITAVVAAALGVGIGATVGRGTLPSVQAALNPSAQTDVTAQNALSSSPMTSTTTTGSAAAAPTGDATQPLRAEGTKLTSEENTISIIKQYEPGLVYVTTESPANPDPFGQMSGGWQTGVGSGFFVDDSGDILTNFHVVTEGGQVRGAVIKVRVQNQAVPVEAEIIGLAPQYDLALIRPKNMPKALIKPIPLGDSSTLEVGQKTVAMGAPFGFDFSVTEGIVSSIDRQIPIGFDINGSGSEGITQNAIQTDAAINPGNSGGPLLDSTGRVIGINTQIISPAGAQSGVGQSAGIGFAIPINTAKNLLPRLKEAAGGLVLAPTIGVRPGLMAFQNTARGTVSLPVDLSVVPGPLRAQYNLPSSGFLIGEVIAGTPAAKSNLRGGRKTPVGGGQIAVGGDVIVSADGHPVNSIGDLQAAYIGKKVGDTVKLEVENGGKTRTVNVTLDQSSFTTLPPN